MNGPLVTLTPQIGVALAMTVHELCTNAIKYGALSNDVGTVAVEWRHEEDKHGRNSVILIWTERGGPEVSAPPDGSTGTGFDISESLLRHSRGVIERHWDREGLRVEIALPIGRASAGGGR